jgi:DNA-binding NtrC family response regulator
LWGSDEADQIKRMLPRLARKTVAATRRALHFQVPAVIEVPAVDPLLERVADMSLRKARAVFEAAYLARQVVRHKGNISAAADAIGMERSALSRKLAGLGIIAGRTRHRKRTPR